MNRLLIISFLIFLNSCSKNFNKVNITDAEPFPVAKVEGKHLVLISEETLIHKKIFESEDCESWAVKLDFDKPLKSSIKNMLDDMLVNYTLTNKKMENQDLENEGYISKISFFESYCIGKNDCI